jgi:hypothetical protein
LTGGERQLLKENCGESETEQRPGPPVRRGMRDTHVQIVDNRLGERGRQAEE